MIIDETVSPITIQQIESNLEMYYRQANKSYLDELGLGKFLYFCNKEGYDTESVLDELDNEPNDCALVDFDEDFPSLKTGQEKRNEIYVTME